MTVFELWQVVRHYPVSRILRRIAYMAKRRVGAKIATRFQGWDQRYAPAGEVRLKFSLPRSSGCRTCFRVDDSDHRLRVELIGETIDLSGSVDWQGATLALRSSHLRRFHLHYMEYLGEVSDAAFERLTRDWIDSNRPYAGPRTDGFASYCISIRAVVWLDELGLRRDRLSASTVEDLTRSLAEQINYLHDYVETDLGGNHLFRNLRTLLWASACIECVDAKRWRRRALRLLPGELRHQFLRDGFHFERSPAYHAQMMLDLADIISLNDTGVDQRAARDIYARAERAYVATLHPDGGVMRFNDGLFGECEARPPISSTTLPDRVLFFENAGFLIRRDADDVLALDVGDMKPDDLPGHAHADIFSFEWSVGGHRIIVDPGVYAYEAGDAREYSRSTAAHSTVSVEGNSQARLYSSFRVGKTPNVTIRSLSQDEEGFDVQAMHDGYRQRFGVNHVRRMCARKDEIEIVDELEGRSGISAKGSLLCHPACAVSALSERSCALQIGDVRIVIESSVSLTISDDDYYECMGQQQITRRICYPIANEATTIILRIVRGSQG